MSPVRAQKVSPQAQIGDRLHVHPGFSCTVRTVSTRPDDTHLLTKVLRRWSASLPALLDGTGAFIYNMLVAEDVCTVLNACSWPGLLVWLG